MEPDCYKIWELSLKTLTFLGLVVAACWAFHKYTDTKEKEFYSVFWNTKLSLFLETSSAASTMATTESIDEFNKARIKYWGVVLWTTKLGGGSRRQVGHEVF